MELKDYYKILETDPSASQHEITRSFRRLAHKYHPDKNPGLAKSDAMFQEIQEAYQILRDPSAREEYNYKRWHVRSLGKHYKSSILAPLDVLAEIERLCNYVAAMNIFHIDNQALSAHIRQLLNETNLSIVEQDGDASLRYRLVKKTLEAADALSYPFLPEILVLLRRVAGSEPGQNALLAEFEKSKQQNHLWDRYKVAGAVILTIVLCVMIYYIST